MSPNTYASQQRAVNSGPEEPAAAPVQTEPGDGADASQQRAVAADASQQRSVAADANPQATRAEQAAAPVRAEPVQGPVNPTVPLASATMEAAAREERRDQSFFPSDGPAIPVEVRIGNGSWRKMKSFKLILPQGSGVAAYLSDDMWSDQGVVWIKKFETDTDIRKTRGSSMMSSPRSDRLDLYGCVTKRGSEPDASTKCDTKVSIAFSNADDYERFLDKIKENVVVEGGKRSSKRSSKRGSTKKRKSTKKRGGKKRTAKKHGAKRSRTRKAKRHGKRRTKKH